MKIPLWIGVPALFALSAVDAALELQIRAVGALTRTVMHGVGAVSPERPLLWDTEDACDRQLERPGAEDGPRLEG
ncbi:hypothetical protein [Rhodococcus sp. NPDC059234]|uniref:hypothetical protein n=1 Tax=Rhodococcus sp. NPDC059234 TaxID=3346781 RepID=UPI00366A75ED